MSHAAGFLGGAKERLLPASIPFRYFATASVFHVLFWLVLFFAADTLAGFSGEPGLVLASIHLLTLGVFVMTAMGAAFQLLPVSTRRPMTTHWPARLAYWLLMPSTLLLTFAMATATPMALHGGAVGVVAALLVFALLTGDNLTRARSAMPVVAAHGWAALAALFVFAGLGLALAFDFANGFLPDRPAIAATHMVFAAFGFMGLLAFGFSHVLIPMFVLSRTLPPRPGWLQFGLVCLAVLLGGLGALTGNVMALSAAFAAGLGASAAYLWLMRTALETAMRKRLGLSFLVIKASWGLLVLALVTGLAVSAGAPLPNGFVLFGFLLLAGWLLTFLLGILQRIMPFLASMHAIAKSGRPPLLSELTAERPLKFHAICHFAALVLCTTGIILDNPLVIKAGAICGLAGAISFATFTGHIITRLRKT
ncbi:MAG TPA: hypothetical protein ENJ99_04100 [Rhizobiales bacterium]|nr:hypothetical protein [Hyphomicrobiales bacterium]